jgi:hypothetical protein
VRREVTIYIGPDGSGQIFEDHASQLLIDALVIDDRGAEPRTARLVVHDVDRLVTSLDRLLDDLSDTHQPELRPSATPAGLRWLLQVGVALARTMRRQPATGERSRRLGILFVTVCILGLSLSTASTSAQSNNDPRDNLLRAAYCIGVIRQTLDVELGRMSAEVPTTQSCQSEFAAYGSAENCLWARRFIADALAEQRRTLEQRLKRYADYLKVRILNEGNLPPTLAAIVAKGKSDASQIPSALPNTPIGRCTEKCQTSFQCVVDCVAEHDQVRANVLRCQLLPDGLPF